MGKKKDRLDIRIKKISLTNFRNIDHAEVVVPGGGISELIKCEPSILGVYGQNGSGKSSLLYALKALKAALSGMYFLSNEFASCIKIGCDFARLEFEFSAYNKSTNKEFEIFYSFSLSNKKNDSHTNFDSSELNEFLSLSGYDNYFNEDAKDLVAGYLSPSFEITDELLQYSSRTKTGKSNKQVLIDTSKKACNNSGKAFGNKSKYMQLTAKGKKDIDELLYRNKIEASIKATSFIFAPAVVSALIFSSQINEYKYILEALNNYGKNYLFVFMTNENARNDMLPLASWIQISNDEAFGIIYPLVLINHCQTSETIYTIQKQTINSTSDVITKIVPGLSIEINDIGKTIDKNGNEFHLFDLLSVRNGIRIPLAYESDGIKRIISFMSFLVAAYNSPSATIAIDELDSGIFEYLLGEILSIMKESAKGQLIFTSHNLRPLEKILPYKNLIFTTFDPEKRFSKLDDVSGNNNLKDKYISLISDGKNKDNRKFYSPTDKDSIKKALEEAGKPISLPEID